MLVMQGHSDYGATWKSHGKISIWEGDCVQNKMQLALPGRITCKSVYADGQGPWCLIFMDSISEIHYETNRQSLSTEICQLVGRKVAWPIPILRGGQTLADCAAWLFRLTTSPTGTLLKVNTCLCWLNVNDVTLGSCCLTIIYTLIEIQNRTRHNESRKIKHKSRYRKGQKQIKPKTFRKGAKHKKNQKSSGAKRKEIT